MMWTIFHVHHRFGFGLCGHMRRDGARFRKHRHGATDEAGENSHPQGNDCGRCCLQTVKRRTHHLQPTPSIPQNKSL
jgi:hypothetical protein